ncbi:hypothetical protein GCM10022232_78830 [Streptomyces plumbiresistens]|uniref:Uncharacterized protein n=1 Tax=Streptomyces plumbiresistens TaxID=511811 RepID=A0ABP7T7Y6_9ACTN
MRGSIFTPCPDTGFSEAGTFGRLPDGSAAWVTVASTVVATITAATTRAILARTYLPRLRAVAVIPRPHPENH